MGDLGSLTGQVISKTQKVVFDASLLNTQHYKVSIKDKVEQSRKRSSALPYTLVEKLSKREPLGHPRLRLQQLTYLLEAKCNPRELTQFLFYSQIKFYFHVFFLIWTRKKMLTEFFFANSLYVVWKKLQKIDINKRCQYWISKQKLTLIYWFYSFNIHFP